MKVYLDHAATTPINHEVADAMIEIIKKQCGNPSSIHEEGRQARALIEKARKSIADNINSSIGEVFFTSSATEANNTILRKAVKSLGVKRIISTPIEHHCVKNTLLDLEDEGVIIEWLTIDRDGYYSMDELRSMLENSDEKTLVSCMYGNNEIGNLYDIQNVAKIAKEFNAYIHSDAVQVLGKFPIDVQELKLDFMSGTAHKINGPKGIGMMYINGDCQLKPFITGGSQERNMRAGTENIYGIVGFSKALEIALQEKDERAQYVRDLNATFREGLKTIDSDIHFNGDFENGMYHICSVNFPSTPKNNLLIYNLDIKGICASSGSACSSGTNTGSHVIEALNIQDDVVTVRFSFSHQNTLEEINYVLETLEEVLEKKTSYA